MAINGERVNHLADSNREMKVLSAIVDSHGVTVMTICRKLDELADKFDALDMDSNRRQPKDGKSVRNITRGQPITRPVLANQCRIQNPLWESVEDDESHAHYICNSDIPKCGGRLNENQGYERRFNQTKDIDANLIKIQDMEGRFNQNPGYQE